MKKRTVKKEAKKNGTYIREGVINFRVPSELKAKIKAAAELEKRRLGDYLNIVLANIHP